jgi:hypothetical protein
MSLDPFDPAAAREKFLNGFLSRVCIDLVRHDALQVDALARYVLPYLPVPRIPASVDVRRATLLIASICIIAFQPVVGSLCAVPCSFRA